MTITARTSLRGVALAVGRALAERGIRAVLTGGACASLHSGGRYLSDDLERVRRWSEGEGHAVRFEEFRRELARRSPK